MLGFHKQMDNRIKLLEEILSFRMQGVEFDNGDMYVDGHKARSEERFSRNAETDLVCRLLLEKKKLTTPPCPCGVSLTVGATRDLGLSQLARHSARPCT